MSLVLLPLSKCGTNSLVPATRGSASGTLRGATYAFPATLAAIFATASRSQSGTAPVFATGYAPPNGQV